MNTDKLRATLPITNFSFQIWKKSASVCIYLWLILFSVSINAQTPAPGAPGEDAQWATAGKQAVGTSASLESKVWFTLAEGVMTEVYYPNVMTANVHKLEFVVVNPKTKKVETESEDAIHEIKVLRPDSLTFQQINTAKSGEWKITKTYTTDVKRNTVLIDVQFEWQNQELNLYVYFDPSVGNSGMHDSAYGDKDYLVADDAENSIALLFSSKIDEVTAGFYQTSDGIKQLSQYGKIINPHKKAENGNVALMARIREPEHFTAVLSLADDFKKSFVKIDSSNIAILQGVKSRSKGFAKSLAEYESEWSAYVKTIPKIEPKYQAQFNMAAMILKAHEDKTKRGANIASLSVPWGGGENANEDNVGGYHLVWSRDLYQVATAFMALGDTAATNRALDFVFDVQQKPDGSVPQNSKLDGTPFWGSLQLDEVAFPLILAYQLKRFDKPTWEKHVKKAADFIVKNGPRTPQERWEEEGGYSPSTIAAEIAGLVCAAEIAKQNGDTESANLYLKTADEWQMNIEKWTATTNGKYGDGNYYLRITQNGTPNAGDKIELNNGAGVYDEREIVDAGFLELVRLGIKSPDDPLIEKSVKVIDDVIRVETPNGDAFYRYNHDGYGEMDDGRRWNFDGKYTGKGRLWALLSGERGQYELAEANFLQNKSNAEADESTKGWYFVRSRANKALAEIRLENMQKFANEGLMIPEQIWDKTETPKTVDNQFVPELKFGEGTGSATPLAWSMAQFIRFAVNLQAGKNLDTPDVVYNRYVLGKKDAETKSVLTKTENFIINEPLKIEAQPCEKSYRLTRLLPIPQVLPKDWKPSNVPQVSINSVNFFYRGNAKKIEIAGDFTNWKPQILEVKNVLDTDWQCFQMKFAPAARVEYKLIVDGEWLTDPLNPNKIDNGIGGENSFFTMPEYQATKWDKKIDTSLFKAKTSNIEIDSKKFGKRTVKVYIPSEYYKRGIAPKLPVLYLQDGSEYIERAKAINVLENLITAKKVEPFIIVFVDPKDRLKEYWANDDWAEFMAKEVVPAIENKYFDVIKNGRENRALLGASLGGITSVHTALKYPEIFGRVGGQSSSFWIDNQRVVEELEQLDSSKNKFKFYFDDGTLEGVEDSRNVVKLLKDKGYNVTYVEAEAGHNWTSWRDRLADAFIALMGN